MHVGVLTNVFIILIKKSDPFSFESPDVIIPVQVDVPDRLIECRFAAVFVDTVIVVSCFLDVEEAVAPVEFSDALFMIRRRRNTLGESAYIREAFVG